MSVAILGWRLDLRPVADSGTEVLGSPGGSRRSAVPRRDRRPNGQRPNDTRSPRLGIHRTTSERRTVRASSDRRTPRRPRSGTRRRPGSVDGGGTPRPPPRSSSPHRSQDERRGLVDARHESLPHGVRRRSKRRAQTARRARRIRGATPSAELFRGAGRTVGDRLGRIVVCQVHPPMFRRDLPMPGAFDALGHLGAVRGSWFAELAFYAVRAVHAGFAFGAPQAPRRNLFQPALAHREMGSPSLLVALDYLDLLASGSSTSSLIAYLWSREAVASRRRRLGPGGTAARLSAGDRLTSVSGLRLVHAGSSAWRRWGARSLCGMGPKRLIAHTIGNPTVCYRSEYRRWYL